VKIAIDSQGVCTLIYNDALEALLEEGSAEVRRASHVEPHPAGGWTADMSPVGGPVLYAADGKPFKLRSEALAAEVAYLSDLLFTDHAEHAREAEVPASASSTFCANCGEELLDGQTCPNAY
jgi:hypothetical protein